MDRTANRRECGLFRIFVGLSCESFQRTGGRNVSRVLRWIRILQSQRAVSAASDRSIDEIEGAILIVSTMTSITMAVLFAGLFSLNGRFIPACFDDGSVIAPEDWYAQCIDRYSPCVAPLVQRRPMLATETRNHPGARDRLNMRAGEAIMFRVQSPDGLLEHVARQVTSRSRCASERIRSVLQRNPFMTDVRASKPHLVSLAISQLNKGDYCATQNCDDLFRDRFDAGAGFCVRGRFGRGPRASG